MSRSLEFLESAPPGAIGLITWKSWIHDLVRAGQASVTPSGEPGLWGHSFMVGKPRADGRIRIYESDIQFTRGGLQNGAQENTLDKYVDDGKNVALCVMDFHLSADETDRVLAAAQAQIAEGLQYPVLELLGTLWAYLTKTWRRPNPLDLERASYCSAYLNDCYAGVERIVPESVAHPTNVSPEHLYRSRVRDPEVRELFLNP